jgi:hypothetical protein
MVERKELVLLLAKRPLAEAESHHGADRVHRTLERLLGPPAWKAEQRKLVREEERVSNSQARSVEETPCMKVSPTSSSSWSASLKLGFASSSDQRWLPGMNQVPPLAAVTREQAVKVRMERSRRFVQVSAWGRIRLKV